MLEDVSARTPIAVLVAGALLVAAPTASAAPFRATLKAGTHHPTANRFWPITVTARSNSGAALRATATYQFVFQGQVVATRYPSPTANPKSACSKAGTCRKSPWPFRGSFRDPTVTWPSRSAGIPLTFRVIVAVSGKGTVKLDYAVRVRR
jgi:hypothetical protein